MAKMPGVMKAGFWLLLVAVWAIGLWGFGRYNDYELSVRRAAEQREQETRICSDTEGGFVVKPGTYVDIPIRDSCWTGLITMAAPSDGRPWHWAYICYHCKVQYSDGREVERYQPSRGQTAWFGDTMPAPYQFRAYGKKGEIRVLMWLDGDSPPKIERFYYPSHEGW